MQGERNSILRERTHGSPQIINMGQEGMVHSVICLPYKYEPLSLDS